jgi:glycosyltransferase involved in cell wall biosynthesis
VRALASGTVQLLGFVSDAELQQAYADSDLAVAPLRFGAGVKGKVIEAMAKAVPVATTSFGAQGIDDPGARLFLGDTPKDLAEAIVLALGDRGEAQKRSSSALDFIADHYSENAMRAIFARLTERQSPGAPRR